MKFMHFRFRCCKCNLYCIRQMNLRSLQTVCLLIILSSCKSLQQSSTHKNTSTTKTSSKTDPRFLDNVSINPGEKKNGDYTYTHAQGGSKSLTYTSSSFNIEKADWLQIKYAIM